MKNEIKVGQEVYTVEGNVIIPYTICSIGRKYFYVSESEWRKLPVDFKTFRHEDKQYSQKSVQFYKSKQDIEDMWEYRILYNCIRNKFNGYSNNLNIDQLRKIKDILEE